MIKIVLLCLIIVISYLIFDKNIQENFKDPAKTITYSEAIDTPANLLDTDNIKIYKTTIGRGVPGPGGSGIKKETKYGLKVSDVKTVLPHAVIKDGQVELVSGESLAAIAFAMCRDNYKHLNRIEGSVNKLKGDVYALETKKK